MVGLLALVCIGELDSLLHSPLLNGATVGVCVLGSDGRTVYERNPDARLVPASNQKIFSVGYALSTLGSSATLKTSIWKGDKRVDVVGGCDPSLTLEQLRQARTKLGIGADWPVHVHSPFDTALGPGWEWDDLPWYYAAPTAALTVDNAAFELWTEGAKVQPPSRELRVTVKWASRKGSRSVRFDPKSNTVTLNGPLPRGKMKLGSFAQPNPEAVAASALGGKYVPDLSRTPSRAADAVIESPAMRLLAKECLETSDNMAAERLMCAAALQEGAIDGAPYPTAPDRMRGFWVRQAGLDPDSFEPKDASGLSRQDTSSARALSQALVWASKQDFGADWLEALAAPGEGTMKDRLKDSSFVGKTGTLHAVVCLSGYVTVASGERLSVSILFNNVTASNDKVREIQDKFVRALEKGQALTWNQTRASLN